MLDQKLVEIIEKENQRQRNNIELIASENFASDAVREITASVLTNKYAEGYPNKRYYGGCQYVDEAEVLAQNYLKQLFKAEHVNVQPHCGSSANMAVYMAVLKPHDRILGMDLKAGGHLTHGYKMSFSGQLFEAYSYGLNSETEMIDYDQVRAIALEVKPKMIVCGASAYSRFIDFKKFREIADEVGAYLMADIAHIAGLVACGLHESPIEYADFVTSTTHKTLRGPRGGIIMCKEKYAKAIDKAVFPNLQGGPLMHVIAAKAQCFYEALQPSFKNYQTQVLKNCQALGETLVKHGLRLVSGGSDNHLILVDLTNFQISGASAEKILDEINITCNKNSIPNDPLGAFTTSGIRLGTPAMTSKGYLEADFREVGEIIALALKNPDHQQLKQQLRERVKKLTDSHQTLI